MANRKFYYQNSTDNTDSKESAFGRPNADSAKNREGERRRGDVKKQPRAENNPPVKDTDKVREQRGPRSDSAKGGDAKRNRRGGAGRNGGFRPERRETPRYDAAKLNKPISALKISENTRELLNKNRINSAADLVRRTEREMFKIQGLNKKILFEVRDALKSEGMAFREEQPKQQPAQTAERERQNPARTENNGNRANGRKPQEVVKPQKQEPRPKLTEPLPVSEWRKVQKGGKWGLFDGFKNVIPAQYDEVYCFKEGLASVESEEKCGYIDSENNIVIPLEYEIAMSFSEGLASVCKNGKCGYIDKNNEIIIPLEYDAATPFEDGEAKVKKDGKWGTITPDGAIKWI